MKEGEASEQAARAQGIVVLCSMLFAGEEPGVIGSTLADLMARFLTNHRTPGPAAEQAMRAELLAEWCETVWKIVAVYDSRGQTKQ
jgi:hypothetical protein